MKRLSKSDKSARPWSESKMSIEFNSMMCKQVLGDEFRHVHEIMEGKGAKAKKTKKGAKRAGFTLIELLVVIAILGILAAILVPAVRRAMEVQRTARSIPNKQAPATVAFPAPLAPAQAVENPIRFYWTAYNDIRNQGGPWAMGLGVISDRDTGREFLLIYDKNGNQGYSCIPLDGATKAPKPQQAPQIESGE